MTIGRIGSASPSRSRPAACGSCSMPRTDRAPRVGPEIMRATGAVVEVIHARARRHQHQRRVGCDGAGIAGPRRRRGRGRCRVRARWRRRPADRRRCRGPGRRWRSGPGDPGPGPAGAWRPAGRRSRGLGALERRPADGCRGGRRKVVRTPVGDKYILEGMQVSGAVLGGEKSGHVIVLEHTTSGDGIVTALEVLRVMTARSCSLAQLAAEIPLLPQQQRAVKARHKDQWEGDPTLQAARSPMRPPGWAAPAASWSVRPARSRRCGSWSRVRMSVSSANWPTRSRHSPGSD